MEPGAPTVFTIGHSNRSLDEFLALLREHGIERVADIRTVPRSRHNPQFNRDALPAALADAGIEYVHIPALGGLRRSHKDSPNTGWRNLSFRGYADYMRTPEFRQALAGLGREKRTALMCAEAVPWRCHRSLVADALLIAGVTVEHITGPGKPRVHVLTPFAQIQEGGLVYPEQAPPE